MGIVRIIAVTALALVLILLAAPSVNEPDSAVVSMPVPTISPTPLPSQAQVPTATPTPTPTPSTAAWQARVDAIEPDQGPLNGGTITRLTGTGLDQVTDVIFGTDNPATIRDRSATSLSVQVPPGPSIGAVDITLVGPAGVRIKAGSYRYVRAAPRARGLDPSSGREGTVVTITGRFPGEIQSVTFGLRPAAILVRARARLVVRAPSQQQPGPVQVTVFGSGGTDVADEMFTYLGDAPLPEPSPSASARPSTPAKPDTPAKPSPTHTQQPNDDDRITVTSTAPASGPMSGGTTVTITGGNLDLVTAVRFGDLPATITSQSGSTLVVTSPAVTGEFTVNIILEHRKGGVEAGRFQYAR